MDQAGETVDDPLIGSTVAGKYLIKSRVGGGAMGVVYEARQVALDKRVAIKVLNRELQTRLQFVSRFHVEAKAASLLDHANSTRVIDFGTDDSGLLYICMEFLEGKNLYEVVKNEWPLEPARIADILSQTLAALAKAHDMGILHRDIKPDNIVLQRRTDDEGNDIDVVKVCDFGIAKLDGVEVAGLVTSSAGQSMSPGPMRVAGPALTNVGLIIGTPDYMSPEQARGEPLDPRSDIYSVGVVLYHMLAGRPPFEGDTAADILTKHITDEPLPPSVLANDVDPELEAICQKAMSKLPDDRFRTAREMRAALRRTKVFQRGVSEQSGPLSIDAPASDRVGNTLEHALTLPATAATVKRPGARSGPAALLVTLVLALAAIAVGFRTYESRATRASVDAGLARTNSSADEPGDPVTVGSFVRSAAPAPDSVPPATRVDPTVPNGQDASANGNTKPPSLAPTVTVTTTAKVPPSQSVTPPPPATTGAAIAADPAATPSPSPAATPAAVVSVAPATPAPPDPVPAPVVAPQPAPFHPENGRVEVAKVETDRVTSRSITDVLRHTNLQRCYVDALTKLGQSRDGTAVVSLDIDQNRVERARFGDTIGLPGMAACIEGQFSHARVVDADTGGATASVTLHFVAP